jgi:hypothetical protein
MGVQEVASWRLLEPCLEEDFGLLEELKMHRL